MSEQTEDQRSIVDRTTEIVQSYLARLDIDPKELPDLIERVGASLNRVSAGQTTAAPAAKSEAAAPAAQAEPAPAEAQTAAPAGDEERPSWMPEATKGPQQPPWNPAVPIENSYTDDYIWCLEDGRKMQMLKRHLKTRYNMSPDQYKRKWGLPDNYPMTAKSYRVARRKLAARTGFQPGSQKAAEASTDAQATQETGQQTKSQSTKSQTTKSQSGKSGSTKSQATKAQASTGAQGGSKSGAKTTTAKSGGSKSTTAKATGTKSGAAAKGGSKSKSGGAKSGQAVAQAETGGSKTTAKSASGGRRSKAA